MIGVVAMSKVINFNQKEEVDTSYVMVWLTNGHAVKIPINEDEKEEFKKDLLRSREKYIQTPRLMIKVEHIVLIDFEPYEGE